MNTLERITNTFISVKSSRHRILSLPSEQRIMRSYTLPQWLRRNRVRTTAIAGQFSFKVTRSFMHHLQPHGRIVVFLHIFNLNQSISQSYITARHPGQQQAYILNLFTFLIPATHTPLSLPSQSFPYIHDSEGISVLPHEAHLLLQFLRQHKSSNPERDPLTSALRSALLRVMAAPLF